MGRVAITEGYRAFLEQVSAESATCKEAAARAGLCQTWYRVMCWRAQVLNPAERRTGRRPPWARAGAQAGPRVVKTDQ